jgi:5-methylcytosine-specific restriction endonuclease McrA
MPERVERWQPRTMKRTTVTKERAHYRSADWQAKRLRILTRDAFTCAACGRAVSGRAAHVDHITPLEEGGTDDDANLQVLCDADHGAKTRAEQKRRGLL